MAARLSRLFSPVATMPCGCMSAIISFLRCSSFSGATRRSLMRSGRCGCCSRSMTSLWHMLRVFISFSPTTRQPSSTPARKAHEVRDTVQMTVRSRTFSTVIPSRCCSVMTTSNSAARGVLLASNPSLHISSAFLILMRLDRRQEKGLCMQRPILRAEAKRRLPTWAGLRATRMCWPRTWGSPPRPAPHSPSPR